MIPSQTRCFWVVITLAGCLCAVTGCDSSPATKKDDAKAPVQKPEPIDPKAFTDAQFERIRNGFAAINVGQMLIQRTHPTGSYVFSNPPQLIVSADRHEIIGKVTVKWTGTVSKAQYETDFTIEITKARVRLTTERDTAVFQIEPNQLRLAEVGPYKYRAAASVREQKKGECNESRPTTSRVRLA